MGVDRFADGWRRHRLVVDTGLALLIGAMATLRVIDQYQVNARVGAPVATSKLLSIALVWCCAVPLAARRIVPEWSFAACMAGFIATRIWEVPEPLMTVVALVCAYISIGVHGSRRWRTPTRVVGTCCLAVAYAFTAVRIARRADLGGAFNRTIAFDVALSVLIVGTAWMLGETWRSRAEYAHELEVRTIELDEQRRLNADRAVIEERLRIARELHDVLAHHVSVMGVQAAAANRVVDRDPRRACESLSVIETSSRQAVDEFRRLVGFLRAGADIESAGPQPSLARCDELLADARRSGLEVGWRVTGEPLPLPPGIDLSAFRVVQEALTNTRKHAGATRADVTIGYLPSELDVTVIDNGTGAAHAPALGGSGLGLIGMRERLRLHEGHLDAGPGADGGYCVHAVFPLRSTS